MSARVYTADEVTAFLSFLYAKVRATHSTSMATLLEAWREYQVYGLEGRPEAPEQMFGLTRGFGGRSDGK